MKKSSIYILTLIAFLLGIIAAYMYVRNHYEMQIVEQSKRILELETEIETLNQGMDLTFSALPSRPIPNEYAMELINNYNCGTTRLKNTEGTVLKGWHIEKNLIEDLFEVYGDRNVSGIQVYLGKHNESDNRSHTLIWMAVRDTTIESPAGSVESMKLLIDRPNTVFQYVKPCPINCPKNDFTIDCD